MKKALSVISIIVLLCGFSATAGASGFDYGDLLNSMYNNSSDMMPKNITMPMQFSITYEYIENGKYKEVIMEKDSNDNYHYRDSEDEYLFVKDGKGYKIAIATVNGFVFKSNDKYTFERVKQLTKLFWACATPLDNDYTMGTTTKEGTGKICGRNTNKFKIDLGFGYSFGSYSMSMSEATYYEFDQETGICLSSSSNEDISVMGMNTGTGEKEGFECIRFELSNILLPEIHR